jgi:hypothetical protein
MALCHVVDWKFSVILTFLPFFHKIEQGVSVLEFSLCNDMCTSWCFFIRVGIMLAPGFSFILHLTFITHTFYHALYFIIYSFFFLKNHLSA